jgi:hypothetical protein
MIGVPMAILVILEGASRWIVFGFDAVRAFQQPVYEKKHTVYDTLLGWVSAPRVSIDGLYGPGIYFRTNASGFRSATDTPRQASADRLRILCSGDSFTLGQGVTNDETWCAHLGAPGSPFESVNLGQEGYGFDQAYLRYRRDGAPLEHSVHILAFITEDFRRMSRKVNWFWGKPVLAVREGTLAVENVPVPRLASSQYWLRPLIQNSSQLAISEFANRVAARVRGRTGPDAAEREQRTRQVVSAIVKDLSDSARARGTVLLLVHLPNTNDYLNHDSDPWRQLMADLARREGVEYHDLIPALRRIPPDSLKQMFIPWGERRPEFVFSPGHYSVAGNLWVAEQLRSRLMSIPAIAARLRSTRARSPGRRLGGGGRRAAAVRRGPRAR